MGGRARAACGSGRRKVVGWGEAVVASSESWFARLAQPICMLCLLGAFVGAACLDSPAGSGLTSEMAIEPPKPILAGFTADPHAVAFGDTYYVYPTSDEGDWKSTTFSCWSSPDLVHWTDQGVILDLTHDLSWARSRAWAPAMIQRDGRYFFYFAAEQKIGVAASDKPCGKLVDALGEPLVTPTEKHPGQAIDPFAFIDDDGTGVSLLRPGEPLRLQAEARHDHARWAADEDDAAPFQRGRVHDQGGRPLLFHVVRKRRARRQLPGGLRHFHLAPRPHRHSARQRDLAEARARRRYRTQLGHSNSGEPTAGTSSITGTLSHTGAGICARRVWRP